MNQFLSCFTRVALPLTLLVPGTSSHAGSWRVEPDWHDFGSIPDTATVEHQFMVVNQSERPLRIQDIALSCERCLSYTLSSDTIAAGDLAQLTIRFDPLGYVGSVELSAGVFTDHSSVKEQNIQLAADIRPLFTWAGDGAFFRELRPHEKRNATLLLRPVQRGNSPELLYAATEYPGLAAKVEPGPDGSWRLLLRAQPPQPRLGLFQTRVHLLSALDQPPVYAVPVILEVVPVINVAPNEVLLDAVDREQFRILFVTQPVDDPVELLDVQLPDKRFHAEIIPDYELANYRINIYAVSLKEADGFEGRIRLLINQPEAEPIDIPLRIRSL